MKKLLIALAAVFITVASYGQGQVVFANKVGTAVDAPVFLGVGGTTGPGVNYSAQLYLQNADSSLTALTPASTFRAAGVGAAAIADRYWVNQTVDVPLAPGANGTFVVRAWLTSLGSFDAAKTAGHDYGQSAAVTVAVGGGTLPPSNLVGLQGFNVITVPEPTIIALGALGASALLLRRRK
jgi:hypothetical protein